MLAMRVIGGACAVIFGIALLGMLLAMPHAALAALLGGLAVLALGGGLALLADPFSQLDRELNEHDYLVHHTTKVDRAA